MKKPSTNINNMDFDITNTVSIVDGDEVVKRDSDEYIYLEAINGVVDQAEEIETIKNRQAIDVLKNGLLGRFNAETGKYEISTDIEVELIKIVKVETSIKGNAIFVESLSSFGGLGKFEFVVKTDVVNGVATSELFVFESVKKMAKTVTNTQIQLVGVFKKTSEKFVSIDYLTRENYYKEMYDHFKIIKQNQALFITEDEQFLQGWIVRRKLYLKSMSSTLDSTIQTAESDLLLNRIEILSTLGEYGYKVLERFEELKGQAKGIVKNGKLSARDQNEILEEAIETFRGKYVAEQEIFFKQQVDSVREYAGTISKLKEKNHKQILDDIEVRLPTVVEIIRKDDERRLEQAKLGESEPDVLPPTLDETKKVGSKTAKEVDVTIDKKVAEGKAQAEQSIPKVEQPVETSKSEEIKPIPVVVPGVAPTTENNQPVAKPNKNGSPFSEFYEDIKRDIEKAEQEIVGKQENSKNMPSENEVDNARQESKDQKPNSSENIEVELPPKEPKQNTSENGQKIRKKIEDVLTDGVRSIFPGFDKLKDAVENTKREQEARKKNEQENVEELGSAGTSIISNYVNETNNNTEPIIEETEVDIAKEGVDINASPTRRR